jgi:metal-responsive CopG/Arc/MetJ family transcriptional regulator
MAKAVDRIKRKQISVFVDEDVLATVDQMADEEDRSRGRLINMLLRKALADVESEQRSPRKRRAA